MKNTSFFSLLLLLSSAAYADGQGAQEITLTETITINPHVEISFKNTVESFFNEIPGKVYHLTNETRSVNLDFENLESEGFDAIVGADENTVSRAQELGYDVVRTRNTSVVVLKTDKHDDIIAWLNL